MTKLHLRQPSVSPLGARLLALLTSSLFLASCATPEGEQKSLKSGFARYSANQPAEAESIADSFITANPNAPTVDEAYYLRGLARMARNNRLLATADLRMAISKTARPDLKGKAYRALGDLSAEQLQWADAQKNYEASLATAAMSAPNVTYLNFAIGACMQ